MVGYGDLGRQILHLLAADGLPDCVAFFDNVAHARGEADCFPFDAFIDARFSDYDFYVGLGYKHLACKAQILRALHAEGRRAPSFVHPSSRIDPTCRCGQGSVIYPMCNLGQEVELGQGVLLNNSVVVSHDSRIGDAVYCSPGVVLSGRVMVGEAAFLGSGTVVSNDCRIGSNARVGIGSVVTINVPEGASAIGNPLRLLTTPLNLQ